MSTKRPVRGPIQTVPLLLIAALCGLSVISAAAAGLGGIRAGTIFAQYSGASVPAPPPMISFDFSVCQGFLDGETDGLGRAWVDHGGNWQCLGSDVAGARDRVSLGHASIDVGLYDGLIITTQLSRISSQRNRSGAGLSLFVDGSSHLFVIYERDQGRLVLGDATSEKAETLVSKVVPDYDDATISVIIDQPKLTVLINGVEYIDWDLSSLDDSILTRTRFGLEADNDNFTYFNTFRVEQLR